MQPKTLVFLKISSFLVFIGRAYQHLFWDAPFRSLLWDEDLLKPIVQGLFKLEWSTYVTNLDIDNHIQTLIQLQGLFYLFAAIIVLLIKPASQKWMRIILYLGGFSLMFLTFLLFKEKSYQIPQILEHSLQFGIVFILLLYLKKPKNAEYIFFLKILIALTFVGHGIYALGIFYPIPSNFITMILNIIPIQEISIISLLKVMGIIDMIIAVLIFIPKTAKWALFYAFVWGILTAFARIVSGLHYDVSFTVLHQYLFETLYRLVHGLIPLLLYLHLKKQNINLI